MKLLFWISLLVINAVCLGLFLAAGIHSFVRIDPQWKLDLVACVTVSIAILAITIRVCRDYAPVQDSTA